MCGLQIEHILENISIAYQTLFVNIMIMIREITMKTKNKKKFERILEKSSIWSEVYCLDQQN